MTRGTEPEQVSPAWHPDLLDRYDRHEWDHFAGYGLTHTEIANRLGWSIYAMNQQANRARRSAS